MLKAQNADIKFERITVNEGLPDNWVQAIYQDYLGYMWFGTFNGLVRYDGANYKIFNSEPDNPYSYRGGSIRNIREDNDSVLWICGTNGLSSYDRKTNHFTRYLPEPDSLNSSTNFNNLVTFLKDKEGNFWLTSFAGRFYRFDKKTETFERIGGKSDAKLPKVFCLFFDLKTVHIASDGVIWIATANGLWAYNPKTKKFATYFYTKDKIEGTNGIGLIAEDKQGTIWTGSNGGLHKVDPKTGKFTNYTFSESNREGMKNDTCKVFISRKNEIWVTTRGYLSRFNPETETFEHFKTGFERFSYLVFEENNDDFWMAFVNPKNQTLTPGYFKYKSHEFNLYEVAGGNTAYYGINNWASFCKDRSGTYWFGSWVDGISHYVPTNNRFTLYNRKIENLQNIDKVTYLFQTGDTLWIGTNNCLMSYEMKTNKARKWDNTNGLSDNYIQVIFKDNHNLLWVGTKRGLNLIDLKSGNLVKLSAKLDSVEFLKKASINSIYKDSKNNFWVGA